MTSIIDLVIKEEAEICTLRSFLVKINYLVHRLISII